MENNYSSYQSLTLILLTFLLFLFRLFELKLVFLEEVHVELDRGEDKTWEDRPLCGPLGNRFWIQCPSMWHLNLAEVAKGPMTEEELEWMRRIGDYVSGKEK